MGKNIRHSSQGFTLMEMAVVLGIFGLVILSISSILIFSFKTRNIIWEQLKTQEDGRRVMQSFVNELRSANYSSIGAYPIEKATGQELIFFSNIDSDHYRERIRYFLDGTDLKKGVVKPSGNPLNYATNTEQVAIVAHDVFNTTTPIFYYYGENFSGDGQPLSLPVSVTQIRVIGIVLDLEAEPNISPAPFHIETKAQIRNLKNN
jgi:prepilin-type N-terminal cleavage/methylation domain-containing protein